MKHAFLMIVFAAACGGKSQTPVANSGGDTGAVKDTRTELGRRRDTACETLGPRITTCAVEDSKAALEAGEIQQKQYDEITKPEVRAKNTSEFVEQCQKADYSSRQVRVLEVCQREESECAPLLACLDNLTKSQ